MRPPRTSAGASTLSLTNLHGDVFATVDSDGQLLGTYVTGPFGEKQQTTTPWNTQDGTTYAYLGIARKTSEQTLAIYPTQMGARVYIPGLGRFLSVDPVQGGTPNSYVYPPDGVNDHDITGLFAPLVVALGAMALRAALPAMVSITVKQTAKYTARQLVKQSVKQVTIQATKQSAKNIGSSAVRGTYRFTVSSGKQYIGKSVDLGRRIGEHARSGKYQGGTVHLQAIPNATNVQLRVQEQMLINQYGGIRGGQLSNKINSISQSNWDMYGIQGPTL